MMTFKQFLNKQDDTIGQEEAISLFQQYKLDFKRQQINEFFLQHKEEEWFKAKYHPEECEKRKADQQSALQARRKMFEGLRERQFFADVTADHDNVEKLTKIMDAAVILLEGGTDLDLTILDAPEEEEQGQRSRQNSENVSAKSPAKAENGTKAKSDGEDGEISDSNEMKKEITEDDDKDKDTEKKTVEPKDLSLDISPEQEELKRKAMEYQKVQEDADKEEKEKRRQKKSSKRKKADYSYESDSGSASSSDSDSDTEPAPPGMEDEPAPPGVDPKAETKNGIDEAGDAGSSKKLEAAEEDNKGKEEEPKPRPLHKTNSIFLRNLAPTITKQEVEKMCHRFPGFIRAALQDPAPERRFMRRGWVTFTKDCNIKEVCWTLNNIRLRDCELGATLNRQLQQRIRVANGLTVHKPVMRNDIKMAAKMIQILDKKWKLWEDEGSEKVDEEKEPQFGFVSKNPVLKNITDFLVEETSYEEEELLGGEADGEKGETEAEITIEKDVSLARALDKMVLYLRLVHSIDYYAANEYPNEDEMPHRCGIMHARGEPPGPTAKMTQADVTKWTTSFEKKMKPFLETSSNITEGEAAQLGRKDPDAEVEKFVQSNTQELSKDKWLCPLSGKKFKGPDFVRKHLFNKHGEKVEEVKQEVKYFNSYLSDPKRPSLPEHPSSRPKPPTPVAPPAPAEGRPDAYGSFTSPAYGGQGRSPYGGGPQGYQNPSPFQVRDSRPPPTTFTPRTGPARVNNSRRSDPRQLLSYTDLDAPDGDGDIF